MNDPRCKHCRRQLRRDPRAPSGWAHNEVEGVPGEWACTLDPLTLRQPRGSTFAEPEEQRVMVALVLTGGPGAGTVELETSWPPPKRIRVGYGGYLSEPVVHTQTDVQLEPGERFAEYERVSYGVVCHGLGLMAAYFPAEWSDERRRRAARRAFEKLEAIAA